LIVRQIAARPKHVDRAIVVEENPLGIARLDALGRCINDGMILHVDHGVRDITFGGGSYRLADRVRGRR